MDSLLIVNFLHPYYTYQCTISAETIGPGPPANVIVTTHQEGIPMQTFLLIHIAESITCLYVMGPVSTLLHMSSQHKYISQLNS